MQRTKGAVDPKSDLNGVKDLEAPESRTRPVESKATESEVESKVVEETTDAKTPLEEATVAVAALNR